MSEATKHGYRTTMKPLACGHIGCIARGTQMPTPMGRLGDRVDALASQNTLRAGTHFL